MPRSRPTVDRFEVWYRASAIGPYLIVLTARPDGRLVAIDPQRGGAVVETFRSRDAALDALSTDHVLVEGEMPVDPLAADTDDDDDSPSATTVRWRLAEAYREYDADGRVYRIDRPVEVEFRRDGTTHRVTDHAGVTHVVPMPGRGGCVLRYAPLDDEGDADDLADPEDAS